MTAPALKFGVPVGLGAPDLPLDRAKRSSASAISWPWLFSPPLPVADGIVWPELRRELDRCGGSTPVPPLARRLFAVGPAPTAAFLVESLERLLARSEPVSRASRSRSRWLRNDPRVCNGAPLPPGAAGAPVPAVAGGAGGTAVPEARAMKLAGSVWCDAG